VKDRFDVITGIRRALVACPDEYPPPVHAELTFIADADLREDLRLDIGAAERSLTAGEWKAASVLAGAVIETLLRWKRIVLAWLQEVEINTRIFKAVGRATEGGKPLRLIYCSNAQFGGFMGFWPYAAAIAVLLSGGGALAQTASDWAVGRWTGYTYAAGSRAAMKAKEVELVIGKRDGDGKIHCRMAYPADIARVKAMDRCSVSADRITFSTKGYEFNLRREGTTLKGKGVNSEGKVAEVEFTYGP
jgi:hypothetical protein